MAEKARLAAFLEQVFQEREQISVFAAQVDNPGGRPHAVTGDGHALEDQVRRLGEDHAILERAGLALVGVAHHDLVVSRRRARELPFHAGGEARAPASTQTRNLDALDDLGGTFRQGLAQGRAAGQGCKDHRSPLAQVVPDHGTNQRMTVVAVAQGELQVLDASAGAQDLDQLARPVARQIGDNLVVDERSRGLIA